MGVPSILGPSLTFPYLLGMVVAPIHNVLIILGLALCGLIMPKGAGIHKVKMAGALTMQPAEGSTLEILCDLQSV